MKAIKKSRRFSFGIKARREGIFGEIMRDLHLESNDTSTLAEYAHMSSDAKALYSALVTLGYPM